MEDINKSNIFAQQGKLSTMFLNIDGNKSNFDEFAVLFCAHFTSKIKSLAPFRAGLLFILVHARVRLPRLQFLND
jgi:hypothetical protein